MSNKNLHIVFVCVFLFLFSKCGIRMPAKDIIRQNGYLILPNNHSGFFLPVVGFDTTLNGLISKHEKYGIILRDYDDDQMEKLRKNAWRFGMRELSDGFTDTIRIAPVYIEYRLVDTIPLRIYGTKFGKYKFYAGDSIVHFFYHIDIYKVNLIKTNLRKYERSR